MAITDINISEQLETGAPSIKYTGNEGPQAPMQMAGADPMLIEEYEKYVYEMQEQGLEPMTFEQFVQEIKSGFAFGGRAGSDGRRRYGIGKFVRKAIPKEIAGIAEVAAPFVAMAAPQFALPAALAGGLGSYKRSGNLMGALKSGAMTYGLGALSPGLPGVRDMGPQSGMFTTQPFGGRFNVSNLFKGTAPISEVKSGVDEQALEELISKKTGSIGEQAVDTFLKNTGDPVSKANLSLMENIQKEGLVKGVLKNIGEAKISTKAMMGILGVSTVAGLMSAMEQPETMESPDRGVGLPGGISGIREEVIEAMKDPSGEKLKALRVKYPFLGEQETKNLDLMAQGGRAGYYSGGQSIPSEYTVEDARKTAMQDKLGGITDIMKKADLHRQGDIGQMYMAEGGLMDLGGMEKDYRNEGGFVPIGKKEKADDVPARLSVNEFVMTADAVRGMGEGDIDLGAERMEDLMETLEAKGKRYKGASDMFEVSERLSAVV